MQRRRTPWIVLMIVVTGCLFTAPIFPTILLGDWGSSQGSVAADSTRVNVAFGCTTVSVSGPVRFDATNSFDVRGYETSQFGPIRFPPDSEPVELLGSLGQSDAPLTLALTLWMLDSSGVRTGSPTAMTVEQGVAGGVYECPVEAGQWTAPQMRKDGGF
jgi:hypothetical protein